MDKLRGFAQNPQNYIIKSHKYVTLYRPARISAQPHKVFSFSLFLKGENTEEWRSKYPTNQLGLMRQIINEVIWNDYGFIHYIHIDAFNSIYSHQALPQNARIISDINELLTTGRYTLYVYDHLKDMKLFWGTLVRYLPMIMPGIDVVLFRDAHATMPNNAIGSFTTREGPVQCNLLDRTWVDRWEAAPFKYMFYTMVGYQPTHAMGSRRPLAGAWGAKKLPGAMAILTEEVFYRDLFNGELALSSVGNHTNYGVDEQLLYHFISTPEVSGEGRAIYIGMMWLGYLFFPQTNLKKFIKRKTTLNYSNLTKETIEVCMGASNILPSDNFYTSARCIIFAAIQIYGHEVRAITNDSANPAGPWDGQPATMRVNEVIECMGRARHRAQQNINVNTPEEIMFENMTHLIPDALNLWDSLFIGTSLDSTILQLINSLYCEECTAEEINSLCSKETETHSVHFQFGGSKETKKSKAKD